MNAFYLVMLLGMFLSGLYAGVRVRGGARLNWPGILAAWLIAFLLMLIFMAIGLKDVYLAYLAAIIPAALVCELLGLKPFKEAGQ